MDETHRIRAVTASKNDDDPTLFDLTFAVDNKLSTGLVMSRQVAVAFIEALARLLI